MNSEREVIAFLRENGCEVYTRGWPDLLVKNKRGHVIGLELKAQSDSRSAAQIAMHAAIDAWLPFRVITRKYHDVADIPEAETIGFACADGGLNVFSNDDLMEAGVESYNDGFTDGYDEGYEDATAEAVGDMLAAFLLSFLRASGELSKMTDKALSSYRPSDADKRDYMTRMRATLISAAESVRERQDELAA